MEPLARAARSAASPFLAGVPLVDHISDAVLSSAKESLLKGLSDAVCAGIGLLAILAAAAAAHAGYSAARAEEVARVANAATYNAIEGGGGGGEGPQLLLPSTTTSSPYSPTGCTAIGEALRG